MKYDTQSMIGITRVDQLLDKSEIKNALVTLLNQMRERGKIEIKSKAKVFIKPNLCCVKGHETGATVDPFLVKCLVEWLTANYNIESIVIGEADATALNADIAFKVLGWKDTFKSFPNVNILNLSRDHVVSVELNGLYFQKLKMPRTYMEANFLISVSKLKTHTMCGISCILKNQYGVNPIKNKARYHKYLSETIYDLNKVKLPDLCIVDGLIGMEGEGPVRGIPKPLGILIIGNDPVSTDYVCAKIMGINPNTIPYLKLAIKNGLGTTKYQVFGKNIKDVKTKFKCIALWKKVLLKMIRKEY